MRARTGGAGSVLVDGKIGSEEVTRGGVMDFVGMSRTLGGLVLLAMIGSGLLLVLLAGGRGRKVLRTELGGRTRLLIGMGWLVAATASGGSLYFSEVVGFVPCLLCWYQRIAMYPLVVVLGVAWFIRDEGSWRYVLPISILGFLVSAYHYTIQWRPALDVVTCDAAAPCTARYLAVMGFMSIPFMAGIGFLLIGMLMVTQWVVREG